MCNYRVAPYTDAASGERLRQCTPRPKRTSTILPNPAWMCSEPPWPPRSTIRRRSTIDASTPDAAALAALSMFDEPLPEAGAGGWRRFGSCTRSAARPRSRRVAIGISASSSERRYPVALGSSWLVNSWDQNAALPVMSPVATKLHDVVRGWLVDVLHLPAETVRRVRQRRNRRERLMSRCGQRRTARRARLGRAGARPLRRARVRCRHRTEGPLDALEVARPRRTRARPRHGRSRRRPRPHAGQPPPRPRRARAGVRAGGRGQQRRIRSLRRDRRLVGRTIRLAARRRCVRTVGPRRPGRGPTSCAGSIGPTPGRRTGTSG